MVCLVFLVTVLIMSAEFSCNQIPLLLFAVHGPTGMNMNRAQCGVQGGYAKRPFMHLFCACVLCLMVRIF